MKKFVSLLAAMALSLMSVTAFAAEAVETDNIHVKLVADKTTIAPGETVTISAFISANGNADVSFDTQAAFGLIFDMDNFDYEVSKSGDFEIGDYSEDFGLLWANDETGMSYAVNTSCVEVEFTAKAEATEGTYAFDVSDSDIDTLFIHDIYVWDPNVGNVTLTGTSVEVKAAGGDDDAISATKTEAANGANTNTYTFENSTEMAGKKVVMQNAKMPTSGMTADTRFIVSDGTRTQIFGSDIWAKLGAEGDGVIDVDNVIFGIIVDAANTSTFTFEVK